MIESQIVDNNLHRVNYLLNMYHIDNPEQL